MVDREENLQKELDGLLKREEILWRDKAKARWIEDGDANIYFFHLTAIMNRRYNTIDHLQKENEDWTNDWHEIREQSLHCYASLFATDTPAGIENFANLFETCISATKKCSLISILRRTSGK